MGQLKSKGVFLMNKYLMMSAAAVLASTGANTATAASFQFGTAGGGSYCDGGTLTHNSGAAYSWQHTNANCASAVSYGQGLLGKTAGLGKISNMSDTYFGQLYGIFSEYLSYTMPKKIKNGAQWTLWVGINGVSSFEGNSGVLINVSPAARKPSGHSKVSTLKSVKQLIALHRGNNH